MAFTIRQATLEDAGSLAEVLQEIGYFAWINNEPSDAVREQIAKQLALCLADNSHSVYVAGDEQDRLLGYVSIHWEPYLIHKGPDGYISELFVRDSARGEGVGSALLERAIAEARRRGCARMMLINMRFRESYLRGFYKKHGWVEREDASNFMLELDRKE